jgi:hypothetical protein
MRQCHQIFVLVGISRATSNPSVKEILDLASRARLSNLAVVCTRSDVS